ncbi:MAG: ornithine cyclodeaminase family protein [Betaproteobacteria bacterium]|nr:ornithine cyclodeaminase family protein [Betaproteobacteria bacterium]
MALLLREEEVRDLLTMAGAIEALEDAFRALARGEASNFPRQRCTRPGVALNVLSAISQALDAAGIKCYPIVRQDVTVGSSFTMLVYRISSGALIGVLEANRLGQVRTGAASAVAMKRLARVNSGIMTLFGTGWQAESQLEAAAHVLPELSVVNVLGRSLEKTRQFCAVMGERLNLRLIAARDHEAAVREADVVTTVTGSSEPVFDGRWLRRGVHVNAVGSNYPEKRELDSAAVTLADVIVVDDKTVAGMECGDLLAQGVRETLDWNAVRSLAHVVGGIAPGRTSQDEITIFESHGIGIEDLAVASHVLEEAERRGVGVPIPLG